MLRYVTPTLYVVDEEGVPAMTVADAVAHIEASTKDSRPAQVYGWSDAYAVLRRIGLTAEEARHRINFARTGDMYATRTAARRQQQRPVGRRA